MDDDLHLIIQETRRRLELTVRSVANGVDLDEAVRTSGLLMLFDDGTDPEDLPDLECDADAQRDGALMAMLTMLVVCEDFENRARSPHAGAVAPVSATEDMALSAVLMALYRDLARYIPTTVWHHRLAMVMGRLADNPSAELIEARADALTRLGGPLRVMQAVDRWEPDAQEQRRLRRLIAEGRESEAVRQALDQAVFAVELEDLEF